MTSVIYFVIVRTTRKPTVGVDDPPKIAGRYTFRVEMQISPKDMGKIKSGLKVKYRLSAFPFFEYKGAEGIITAVDPDIRSGNNGLLYYIVYADLDRVVFKNRHGDSFPVRSGLETDARIVLETESIIYYILRKIDFLY